MGLYPSPQCPEYRKAFENSEMKRLPFNICFLQQQHENPISRLKTTSQTNKIGHFSAYCQYARNRMNCSVLYWRWEDRASDSLCIFLSVPKRKVISLLLLPSPQKERKRPQRPPRVHVSISLNPLCDRHYTQLSAFLSEKQGRHYFQSWITKNMKTKQL